MTSNNDCCVRLFDVEGCRPRARHPFGFAVNYATLRPPGAAPGGGAVAAVVGDDPLTWLIDLRCGVQVGAAQSVRLNMQHVPGQHPEHQTQDPADSLCALQGWGLSGPCQQVLLTDHLLVVTCACACSCVAPVCS